jgi:gas vesicle protein
MGSGKVLASVLAGAAAGAILGILFAPDKGTETRRKIAEKGAGLADSVKGKVSEYTDAISEKYDSVKEKLTGLASEGRDMVNQARGGAGAGTDRSGTSMKADVRNSMNS